MGYGMRPSWLPAVATNSGSRFAGKATDPVCRRVLPPFANQDTARLGGKALAHASCDRPSKHCPTYTNGLRRRATLFNGEPSASIAGLPLPSLHGQNRMTARRTRAE